jgi:ELWxxDGT repeat protein
MKEQDSDIPISTSMPIHDTHVQSPNTVRLPMNRCLNVLSLLTLVVLCGWWSAQAQPTFTFGQSDVNGFTPLADVNTLSNAAGDPQALNRSLLSTKFLCTTWDANESHIFEAMGTLPTEVTPGIKAYMNPFSAANGLEYFKGVDATGVGQPWVTDGTVSGTRKLLNLSYGSGVQNDVIPYAVGTTTYMVLYVSKFNGTGGSNGMEATLYKTNGTTSGTTKLKSWSRSSGPVAAFYFKAVNNTCVFLGRDGYSSQGVWVTDGSAKGTKQISTVDLTGTTEPAVLGSYYYFNGNDASTGVELWRTNGTSSGTTRVADLNPGSGSSSPSNLTVLGGKIYFTADAGGGLGRELYVYDPAATPPMVLAANINPTAGAGSDPRNLTVFNNKLYFSANDGTNGWELWVYEPGAPASCHIVADIFPGIGNGDPHYCSQSYQRNDHNSRFTEFNGALYFAARTAAGTPPTYRMFRYDGVNAPAIVTGYDNTGTNLPTSFTVFGGTMYFMAYDTYYGNCLWKYVPPTPKSVADVRPPLECTLEQNHPNPFSSVTTLGYTLHDASHVRLTITDMLGREVAVLVDQQVMEGNHTAVFNAGTLPNGSYLLRLTAGEAVRTRMIKLLR